jgi:hypothetical protein
LSSFFLRYPGYLYLAGGQDQGLYLVMAHKFRLNHTFYFRDTFKDGLDSNQKDLYYKYLNYIDDGLTPSQNETKYHVCFYPLHPVFLALTADILGESNQLLSLTLFSLISILAIYLLTTELTFNPNIGITAALFLAVNPFHSFFSKFPVTEVPTLAVSLLGFYYLLRFYHHPKTQSFSLILSLLCFNSLFYFRISGFLYLPFFAFLFFLFWISRHRQPQLKPLLWYFFSWFGLFFLSLYFYYHLINDLLLGTFVIYFSGWISSQHFLLAIFIIILLLFIFLIITRNSRFTFISPLIIKTYFLVPLLLTLTLVFHLWQFIHFAFNPNFPINPNYLQSYIAGHKIFSFPHTSLWVILAGVTPLGFFFVLKFIFRSSPKLPFCLLSFFSVLFIVYNLIFYPYFPYQFYYSRYLVSEVIPYCLVVISISLYHTLKSPSLFLRLFGLITIIVISLGQLGITTSQMNGIEGPDPSFFQRLNRHLNPDSVVYLINTSFRVYPQVIKLPLKHYFDHPTFSLDRWEELELPAIKKIHSSRPAFVLAQEVYHSPDLTLVDTLSYQFNYFSNGVHLMGFNIPSSSNTTPWPAYQFLPPTQYYTGHLTFYLYSINYHSTVTDLSPRLIK